MPAGVGARSCARLLGRGRSHDPQPADGPESVPLRSDPGRGSGGPRAGPQDDRLPAQARLRQRTLDQCFSNHGSRPSYRVAIYRVATDLTEAKKKGHEFDGKREINWVADPWEIF